MALTTRLEWTGGVAFKAQTGTGHEIIMDGAPEAGGLNTGARPMEMVLTGLAGCTLFDVVEILKKMRVSLKGVSAEISGERADMAPKVFTAIHMAFTVTGGDINQAKAERAVSLSVEKYCSAAQMLNKTAEITYSVTIVTED